jgi:cellulose synthase/poly-beta-1,6-N-acetylglucosamine synthase-like glycosyltransferase
MELYPYNVGIVMSDTTTTIQSMTDPRICVLIPAYNEELVLEDTIDALLDAECDREDIYVVNDRSSDNTILIAIECGVNVFTVPENGGKARAQAAALEHFDLLNRYDWVIFLDGDTKVDLGFFNRMFEAAKTDPSIALYVGQVKSVKNNHIYSASRAFDYTYGQDVGKHGQSNFNVIFVSPGCASMYRTDVLAKLHIDHLTLAEDMDLTMQVHRAGGKVLYVPQAIVNTQDPSTFSDYHKQILRWYRGFWQVVKKHNVFGFSKKQRVDWYMILITLDALIMNRPLWIAVVAWINPSVIPWALLLDFAVSFVIAFYAGYRTQRLDVITKFPLYYWMAYLNFYAYTRAFIEIIVLRKEILAWNKVKRYDFTSNSAV